MAKWTGNTKGPRHHHNVAERGWNVEDLQKEPLGLPRVADQGASKERPLPRQPSSKQAVIRIPPGGAPSEARPPRRSPAPSAPRLGAAGLSASRGKPRDCKRRRQVGRLLPFSPWLGRRPELLPRTGSSLVSIAWSGGVTPYDIHCPRTLPRGGWVRRTSLGSPRPSLLLSVTRDVPAMAGRKAESGEGRRV